MNHHKAEIIVWLERQLKEQRNEITLLKAELSNSQVFLEAAKENLDRAIRAELRAAGLEKSNSDLVEAVDAAIKDREYFSKKLDETCDKALALAVENEELKRQLEAAQQSLRAHIQSDDDHEPCPYCQQEKQLTALRAESQEWARRLIMEEEENAALRTENERLKHELRKEGEKNE